MSANDYLFLTIEGNKYILSHRDADTNAEFERWEFDKLEEALAKAEEEQGPVQLSQVPNPQVVKKEKKAERKKPLNLGSFWRDEY